MDGSRCMGGAGLYDGRVKYRTAGCQGWTKRFGEGIIRKTGWSPAWHKHFRFSMKILNNYQLWPLDHTLACQEANGLRLRIPFPIRRFCSVLSGFGLKVPPSTRAWKIRSSYVLESLLPKKVSKTKLFGTAFVWYWNSSAVMGFTYACSWYCFLRANTCASKCAEIFFEMTTKQGECVSSRISRSSSRLSTLTHATLPSSSPKQLTRSR